MSIRRFICLISFNPHSMLTGWVSLLPFKAKETHFFKVMLPIGVVRSVIEGRLVRHKV